MTTHSSSLFWKVPWTDERGGLQSMEPQRWILQNMHVHTHTHTHTFSFEKACIIFVLSIQYHLLNCSSTVKFVGLLPLLIIVKI